ncbi:MAG: InlB B-repeat-containing protein [Holdemanella porci]
MKKLLSMFLALCMTFLFIPTTVFAEETPTEELQRLANEAMSGNQVLTLEKDYTITDTICFNKNFESFTLDLNGHVIRNVSNKVAIQVGVHSGCSFILEDSAPSTTHYGDYASLPAGGVITGTGYNNGCGGGFHFTDTNFIMNGGTIYNCSAALGGGVFLNNNVTFTMNGGTISKCVAVTAGGGVYIEGGSFIMNGGIITECETTSSVEGGGAAVSFGTGASNVIVNGKIENCHSYDRKSDALYFRERVKAGGTITGTVLSEGTIRQSDSQNTLIFKDTVYNKGNIEYGAYYGGIVNEGNGTISESYHTVSFDLDGGKNPIPTQYFVNINNLPALEPENPTKDGYEFTGWYQGNTKYDFTQNVTENITLTAHWEIAENPVINGLEDGKTYCDTVQFDVSDNVGVGSVSANGVELTPDANGKYSLENESGLVTIIAKDKAGNKTTVTVTVNNRHSFEHFDAKEASFTEAGNIEYWYCNVCEKYFSDAQGTKEISLEDTILSKTVPEIIKGKGQSVIEGTKKALSFTSNAPFNQFKQVKLDGKTLDSKNYTVKEGSIVVTLNSDFVSTLKAGKHTISIVSETGEATTEFNVVKDTSKKTNTGIIGNAGLWISMMVSSLDALLIGFVLKRKNRK